MITQSFIKEFLDYSKETGKFVWRKKPNRNIKIGSLAGCPKNKNGYIIIGLNGFSYLAHRLAWVYIYGNIPSREIDHINGIKDDNRIENLRPCSSSENHCNKSIPSTNTSGFKGVSFCKRENKFRAYIKKNGKYTGLGYYNSPNDAYKSYCNAAKIIHGEFACLV